MKTMKKCLSLIVALMLTMSLAVPTFAADDTYSLTITGTTGHTYEIYQIFTGDLADVDGAKVLSNVVWGSGVTDDGKTKFDDAAAKAESLTDDTAAKAFADAVVAYLDEDNATVITDKDGNGIYEASDLAPGYYLVKDKTGTVPAEGEYTQYILKVVGDAKVNAKSSETTSEKSVKDTNDSVAESTTVWQESADYDIGDDVPFQLKATITANYDLYETYKLVFHDKESEGLDFNADSVKVYVDGVEINDGYVVVTEELDDECTFEVRFADLKKIDAVKAGSVITVEYTSTLTENATVGSAGNLNKMYLEYSNNPNSGQEGSTGKTPEDTVIVFTYKVVVNKVDENKDPLEGAEFTLEKYDAETDKWTAIEVVKNDTGTVFTFSGLDDGEYRLTETKTPAGYNTIDPIEFTVTASHEGLTLTGLAVDEKEITFTPDLTEGSLTTDIVNQKGATLPETGGMGTTLFYIAGGILIVGALVAFVTKKRMEE